MAGRASSQRTQKENANLIHQSMLLEGCKRLQDILDISEIPHGGLRNVVDFFFFYIFLNSTENKKGKGHVWREKHQKLRRNTCLQVNFGLFNSHQ